MSELNRKQSGKLNYIILGLVMYVIIALGVTFYLIYMKNNSNLSTNINTQMHNSSNDSDSKSNYSNIERISLLDKYYLNNIKVAIKERYAGDVVSYDYDNKPQYQVTIVYSEISGLKNEKIEDKINSKIESKVNELIDNSEIKDSNINNIYISADVCGNFSDVLSVALYKSIFYSNDNVENKYEGINFRLDTGEELELEDLFTEDVSIKNILAQSAYKNLGFEYGINEESDMNSNMDNIDYSKIENQVYKIVSLYNKNPDIEFYFDYSTIFAIIGSDLVTIDMKDFDKYINIYNLTKSNQNLYIDGNREKINYVFGMPVFENYEYFDKISNNIFLSIYNYYNYTNRDDSTYDENYTEFMKILDKYEQKIIDLIKENEKENAVIYNINYLDVNKDGESPLLRASGEKIVVKNLNNEIDKVYSKASRTYGTDGISMLDLYEEYKIYNIQIEENEYGELNLIEEEMTSYMDI